MPIYEYACETHGLFEATRPMAEYADPCDCPECGSRSPRVMVTVPRLATMDGARRHAHATNERSAHEPRSSRKHGAGCGCCGGGAKKGSGALHRPDGSKSFPARRPWMISH